MITDLAFLIAGTMLNLFSLVLSALDWVIPTQIKNAITYFAGFQNYLSGILPIDQIDNALVAVILVWSLLQAFKIFLRYVFPVIPLIGKKLYTGRGDRHETGT